MDGEGTEGCRKEEGGRGTEKGGRYEGRKEIARNEGVIEE
jgi:hypothetical protein